MICLPISRSPWLLSISILIMVVDCYVISESNEISNSIDTKPIKSGTTKSQQQARGIADTVSPKLGVQVLNDGQNDSSIEDSSVNQLELEQFWLNKRDQFFNITSFNLSRATNELVGEDYGNRSYHLPFWFDYEMFKNLTERVHADAEIDLKRHHIYIDNCVSIWENTAYKRLHQPNNFTFIDLAEDWTQTENYNEEWGEIAYNLTGREKIENPIAKGVRLVQEKIRKCTSKWDKNLCILLLIDLDERFGPAMKLRYPFEEERYRSLLDIDAAGEAASEFTDALLSTDGKFSYWLDRRDDFFRNTSFSLNEKVKSLVGPEYGNRVYHLPFWFDYEVFKRMVGRINETPQEELKSHHKYIDSCLEIWNDTATERLGQLDYEAGGITSHVDIPARTCLYNCNPFDYDLTEEEIKESPVDKAKRLVLEELDGAFDKKRTILLLVELEEKFDFPRARGMRYPFEAERTREEFWTYVEERDKAIAEFVKSLG